MKLKKVEKKRSRKLEYKLKVDNSEGTPNDATYKGSNSINSASSVIVSRVRESSSSYVSRDIREGAPRDNSSNGGNIDKIVGVEETSTAIEAEGKVD